jgi:hypothetical protein
VPLTSAELAWSTFKDFPKSWRNSLAEESLEAFMRVIVSNLTAAMLLVHALVGCCRYYEHNCGRHDFATDCVSVIAACCDHCHGRNEAPTRPENCGFECQGVCTYLPPQKTFIDSPHSNISRDFLPLDPPLADNCLASASFLLEQSSSWSRPELPLRLHLLHQIILV